MRQTKKDDPHMNSGGIALRHVQDVAQFAISIPPPMNMPIPEHGKKERRRALRQAPLIATGEAIKVPQANEKDTSAISTGDSGSLRSRAELLWFSASLSGL
jgi:hypothetical protein